MIPFNYHHLYYFYVISKSGSISKAGEELGLAQPTLSAQLKQFEQFLNIQLFTRENKRLTLTEEGRQVLFYAKMIFDIGRELKDRLGDLNPQGKTYIQIGVTPFVPKTILDLLLNFILKIDSSIHLTVKTKRLEQLITDLEDHLLDLIMTDTPFEATMKHSLINKFIGKVPIVFCAHSSLAKKIRRFPKDLALVPLILPSEPPATANAIREYLYEHHIDIQPLAEIQDLEIARRLVLRGYGVAPINLLTVREAPSRQHLVILDRKINHNLVEKVYLITKKKKRANPVIKKITEDFNIEKLFLEK